MFFKKIKQHFEQLHQDVMHRIASQSLAITELSRDIQQLNIQLDEANKTIDQLSRAREIAGEMFTAIGESIKSLRSNDADAAETVKNIEEALKSLDSNDADIRQTTHDKHIQQMSAIEAVVERISKLELFQQSVKDKGIKQDVDFVTEPRIEITGDAIDGQGIQIQLDWNIPFISYLKENGYDGKSDEEIVRKWIASLTETLHDDLEDRAIEENSKRGKPSEFE